MNSWFTFLVVFILAEIHTHTHVHTDPHVCNIHAHTHTHSVYNIDAYSVTCTHAYLCFYKSMFYLKVVLYMHANTPSICI